MSVDSINIKVHYALINCNRCKLEVVSWFLPSFDAHLEVDVEIQLIRVRSDPFITVLLFWVCSFKCNMPNLIGSLAADQRHSMLQTDAFIFWV